MERKELAVKLRNYRKANNLTQYDLAIELGCHINTYRLWEQGVSTPGEELQLKLEEILKEQVKTEGL